MKFQKDNPFLGANRSPIDGKLHDAITWERNREIKRRKTLPIEEQKRLFDADKNFQRKMQSSISKLR